jgi:ATP-binding cassette, subfamily B, bacterial
VAYNKNFTMKDQPQEKRPQLHVKETLHIYLHATLQHRRESLRCLLLPLGNILFTVLTPYYASHVLAAIITRGPQLWFDFGMFAGTAVAGLVLNAIGIRACTTLQAQVMYELNDYMFSRLLQRSVGFFNNQVGGKLVSDALDFVNYYGQLFNVGFVTGSAYAASTLVGLLLVFASNWVIGLAVTTLLAFLIYWTVIESRKRSDLRNERLVLSKQLTARISDNIVNAVTVKTFANESLELGATTNLGRKLAEVRKTDWRRNTTTETMRMGVLLLMQIVLVLLLILLTKRDRTLIGTGIFAFTYTLTLVNRYFNVGTMIRQIEECFLQSSTMTELLQEPIEISDAPDAKPLVVKQGEIICKNVAFRYGDTPGDENVFEALNLHIAPGEKIGLVGHSGGGKSTLTRLLLRFDDVTSGSITIDGQTIHEVTQGSLRRQISYVPQEPLLFHRTIRENIAYGSNDATQDDIEKAATLAYAHEFIMKLPKGYDTAVGERGVKLSGGQRQRIAIARAMLKNAPILVLDEATSALDSESEKAIQGALWKLMSGKTTVVIAHRLSTIQKMDRILVLSDGKIVEDGSHDALLKRAGTYAKLWAHQSGGFIEE